MYFCHLWYRTIVPLPSCLRSSPSFFTWQQCQLIGRCFLQRYVLYILWYMYRPRIRIYILWHVCTAYVYSVPTRTLHMEKPELWSCFDSSSRPCYRVYSAGASLWTAHHITFGLAECVLCMYTVQYLVVHHVMTTWVDLGRKTDGSLTKCRPLFWSFFGNIP